MTRTWPVPLVPGEYARRPTYLQRIQAGLHPRVRRRHQIDRDELLVTLRTIDDSLEQLSAQRVQVLDQLDALRDQLWPEAPNCRGRRPPALDRPPLPPMVARARRVGGRSLRGLCLTMLARCGPMTLPDMHAQLHAYGYGIAGDHTVKTLADAMGYEVRCGRAIRVRRGVYDVAPVSRRGVGRDPRPDTPETVEVAPWSSTPIDPSERTDPDRWIPQPWPDPEPDLEPDLQPDLEPDLQPDLEPDLRPDLEPNSAPPTRKAFRAESAQNLPRTAAEGGWRPGGDGQPEATEPGHEPERSDRSSDTPRSPDVDSVAPDEGPP